MGIDITNNKEISLNNTHQKLVNTDTNANPTSMFIHDITIHFIYRRIKTKNHQGDGNPFIYALKNKNGYTISKNELINFLPSFHIILDKILLNRTYDLILILPSSSTVVKRLGKKVALKNTLNNHYDDIFLKKTIAEVLQNFNLAQVSSKHLKDVKHQLSILKNTDQDKYFSMKDVKPKIREYFNPLKITTTFNISSNSNVLLVDDLFATGNTIKSAKELLTAINPNINIDGLCLFSGI